MILPDELPASATPLVARPDFTTAPSTSSPAVSPVPVAYRQSAEDIVMADADVCGFCRRPSNAGDSPLLKISGGGGPHVFVHEDCASW